MIRSQEKISLRNAAEADPGRSWKMHCISPISGSSCEVFRSSQQRTVGAWVKPRPARQLDQTWHIPSYSCEWLRNGSVKCWKPWWMVSQLDHLCGPIGSPFLIHHLKCHHITPREKRASAFPLFSGRSILQCSGRKPLAAPTRLGGWRCHGECKLLQMCFYEVYLFQEVQNMCKRLELVQSSHLNIK